MDFGDALRAMKAGKRIARVGWNGKGMYLWVQTRIDIVHLSRTAGVLLDDAGLPIQPSICMRTAQDTLCIGWLASQADMFAEDWQIL